MQHEPGSRRRLRIPRAPMLALALGLAACAPPEADYPISDRARAAPAPRLEPTAGFALPRAKGGAAIARLGPERDALAARAAALRARGEALSAGAVVDDDRRARLAPPAATDRADP